jgi:hypothetical protein
MSGHPGHMVPHGGGAHVHIEGMMMVPQMTLDEEAMANEGNEGEFNYLNPRISQHQVLTQSLPSP